VRHNYLVVAANGQVREELAVELRAWGYSVTLAASGAEAERVLRSAEVEKIVIESHLPDVSADELRKRLRQIRPDSRVMSLTSFELARAKPDRLLSGGNDYLLDRVQLLELIAAAPAREDGGAGGEVARRGHDALLQVIDVLVGLHELEDRYFGGSSHQVMRLVRAAAEEFSDDNEALQEVVLATLLRDVGKAAVEAEVRDSAGEFSDEHRQQMNEHVLSTLRLFEHIDFPWKVVPIIRHHHERYDGTGYPDGLKGREIPVGARIVSVVDAFVAMTSHRAHRTALSPSQALQELIRQAGHQFDPEVVEAFQRVLDQRMMLGRRKRKRVVLVIEPDEEFQQLLAMRLLNEGFDVRRASSYDAGLEIILKDAPDLVVADADADVAESFQLLRELREDRVLCHMPFVLMSNSSDRVLKLRALREGVDEFFSKGQDLEEVVAHIENIVTREALRRGSGQRPSRRGITGSLEHLALPDIVQTLVIGMKTACVSLSADDRSGQIWFENGAPKHATAGELEGEAAFFEMVRWSSGEFVIEHGVKAKQCSLNQDAMFLLMEGLRLMDEASAGEMARTAS